MRYKILVAGNILQKDDEYKPKGNTKFLRAGSNIAGLLINDYFLTRYDFRRPIEEPEPTDWY